MISSTSSTCQNTVLVTGLNREEIFLFPDYPTPVMLPAGGEVPMDIELDQSNSDKSYPLYQDSINHKPSREECMRKLQTGK